MCLASKPLIEETYTLGHRKGMICKVGREVPCPGLMMKLPFLLSLLPSADELVCPQKHSPEPLSALGHALYLGAQNWLTRWLGIIFP